MKIQLKYCGQNNEENKAYAMELLANLDVKKYTGLEEFLSFIAKKDELNCLEFSGIANMTNVTDINPKIDQCPSMKMTRISSDEVAIVAVGLSDGRYWDIISNFVKPPDVRSIFPKDGFELTVPYSDIIRPIPSFEMRSFIAHSPHITVQLSYPEYRKCNGCVEGAIVTLYGLLSEEKADEIYSRLDEIRTELPVHLIRFENRTYA